MILSVSIFYGFTDSSIFTFMTVVAMRCSGWEVIEGCICSVGGCMVKHMMVRVVSSLTIRFY